jgi:hypothetical protein
MKALVIPANSSEPVTEIDFDQDKAGGMSSRDTIPALPRWPLTWPSSQNTTPRVTT